MRQNRREFLLGTAWMGAAAMAAGATTETIGQYAHTGTMGIMSAILATFAIAPWAYVGFDAIPQAAEEFNFSFKDI